MASNNLIIYCCILFIQLISIGETVINCEQGRKLPDSLLPIFDAYVNLSNWNVGNKKIGDTTPQRMCCMGAGSDLTFDDCRCSLAGQSPSILGSCFSLIEFVNNQDITYLRNMSWLEVVTFNYNDSLISFPDPFPISQTPNVSTLMLRDARITFNTSVVKIKDRFPSLKSLSFDNCALSGPIPTEIGLSNLTKFSISNTDFNVIPSEIGLITTLNDLEFIKMSGLCPSWIFKPRNLNSFHLKDNGDCEVTFPDDWNSSHINYLGITRTKFNGTLPPSFFLGSDHDAEIYLWSNNLTGNLPPVPLLLSHLEITDNSLTGPITFVGNTTPSFELGMGVLASMNNFDSLFIPAEMRIPSTRFSNVVLSMNNFSSFPMHLTSVSPSLIDLSYNKISGLLPSTVFGVSSILYLNNNQINGVDGEILKSTTDVDLSNNPMTNFTVNQLSSLFTKVLNSLNMINCTLNLNMSLFSTSIQLRSIDLSRNNLSGVFNFSLFPNAYEIDISNNPLLQGTAPADCGLQRRPFVVANTSIYDPCNPPSGTRTSLTTSTMGSNGNGQNLENSDSSLANNMALIGGVVGGGIGLICIIFLVVLVVCVTSRRNRQAKRKQQGDEIALSQQSQSKSNDKEDQSNYSPISKPQDHLVTPAASGKLENRTQSKPKIAIDDPIKKYEIIYSEIEFERKIGSGNFGEVWKGQWRGSDVAIKKLLAQDEEKAFKEFALELAVMLQMRAHENVILLKGFCIEPRCIITQFVEGGDLSKYLKSISSISENQLIHFCEGIAKGLLHLHEEGIVHRDLAARNILISDAGEQLEAIISDFGLSRDLSVVQDATYISQATTFPLKWLAPECLSNREFSSKTDVWAFGCTVVEIFDSGKLYADVKDRNVLMVQVRDGLMKPTIPSKTPKFISEILDKCFEFNPETRSNMQQVCAVLQRK